MLENEMSESDEWTQISLAYEEGDDSEVKQPRRDTWFWLLVSLGIEILLISWLVAIGGWLQDYRGGLFQEWTLSSIFIGHTQDWALNIHAFWAVWAFIALPMNDLIFRFVFDSRSTRVKFLLSASLQALGILALILSMVPLVRLEEYSIGVHIILGMAAILMLIWLTIVQVGDWLGFPWEHWIDYARPTFGILAQAAVVSGFVPLLALEDHLGWTEIYFFQGLLQFQLIIGCIYVVLSVKKHYLELHWNTITQTMLTRHFFELMRRYCPKNN